MDPTLHLALVAAAWAAYGALHSLLASTAVKRRFAAAFPARAPAYRLLYNAAALLLLVPVAWPVLAWDGPPVLAWRGPWEWAANAAALLALAGFAWSLRFYSGQDFLGLRQWREGDASPREREGFVISPLHRWVRHPWYSLGLLLLWTRDLDAAQLVSAGCITLYFVIGSRLEEEKLVDLYGDAYRRYRERVPALLPRPWRRLPREEAARLAAAARRV